jgi:N-methylhydantoinase A
VRLGVDIGGTFTDLVAYDATRGETVVSKVLGHGAGPQRDVAAALDTAGIEPEAVTQLTHGTTAVTNLLIERTGATVGVITTRGFRDLLEIQQSYRRRSIDIEYDKTPPIVPRRLRFEIAGRIDASGREVEPIDVAEVKDVARELVELRVESIAIALYNAYANASHEQQVAAAVAEVARDLPVTLSTEVDRRIGEYERLSTAVLNAMAVPRMHAYVDDLAGAVPRAVHYMQSGAGALPADEARARPIQLALSGPAAGVLASRAVARRLGRRNVITMDMGGTSADVSLIWDDEFRFRTEIELGWGIPARTVSLDVQTIGAGGGSICWRDSGGGLQVGPRSAGAVPGPACYGRGGELPTVTDANLVLGLISPDGLLGGSVPLDVAAARTAFEGLASELETPVEEVARGVYTIVSANMAQAIREITVRKGIDPRECALIAFGGAGAQHAAEVAAALDIRDIVIPAHASVLSAVGLMTAPLRVVSARTVLLPLAVLGSTDLERVYDELLADATRRLGRIDAAHGILAERLVAVRYVGQWHELSIPFDENAGRLAARFEDEHERLYGTRLGDPLELVECAVALTVSEDVPDSIWTLSALERPPDTDAGTRFVYLVDEVVPVHARPALDAEVAGPCIVEEAQSVTWVPPGSTARLVDEHLLLERAA